MVQTLKSESINELFDYIAQNGTDLSIYIGVDVGKNILDIGITISDSDLGLYLGTIENNIEGFKQVEKLIIELICIGIDENKIYFGTENTGIYGHDIMNFFDDRIPNTYTLNSSLTCHARQYYAKTDLKSDNIDAIIISMTLRDLDNKNRLESIWNPYKKCGGLGFVRRSMSNERDSLRILFRRLSILRCQKSKLMTSINIAKERLFPEINGIFSIKHRSSSEMLLLNLASREDMLNMTKSEFISKYKNIARKGQKNSRVISKIETFYDRVKNRGIKNSRSNLDKLTGNNSDSYLLEEINFKLKHYELTVNEINTVMGKISNILQILKNEGYFIPHFVGINEIEIGLILGEIGSDIYNMSSKEFIGFVGRYPENYTSGGGHIVKESKLSHKKGIIKKFVYIRMYGFQMHNPSFRMYKKLLMLYYGIDNIGYSTTQIKTKRKIEIKCGEKLLKIIHDGYKNKRSFDEKLFIESTINPLIQKIKDAGISDEIIEQSK